LQDQLSDPETRALAAVSKLERLAQGKDETVSEFIDRYTTIVADLPYRQEDPQRVLSLLPKFRSEIRLAVSCMAAVPSTYTQLVSAARRIEDSQRAVGASAYRPQTRSHPTSYYQPPPAPLAPPSLPLDETAATSSLSRRCYACTC
jgi:hypothetical protein